MLAGLLARVVALLLGGEGRSLYLKAAGGATAVLGAVMLVGSSARGPSSSPSTTHCAPT